MGRRVRWGLLRRLRYNRWRATVPSGKARDDSVRVHFWNLQRVFDLLLATETSRLGEKAFLCSWKMENC